MAKTSYTSKDIQELSQLEHLRQNASMYIGGTENPTHLLYEVLDNALDEANAKFASLVLVNVDLENGVYAVADNGRGIPFDDGALIKIATKMFSGGKFKKGEESAYGTAIGLHGIGMFAVTGLSDWVKITVYRDGKKAFYKFVNCEVAEEKIENFTGKAPYSTLVEFKPSKKYFESTKVDLNRIKTRLQLATVHIENLRLIFVNGKDRQVIKMTMNDYFDQNFWKGQKENITPLFQVSKKVKDEEVRIMFGWDMSSYSQPIAGGSVNLLPVPAGTHINRTYTLFKDVFSNIAKKEKLNYNENDFRIGFRVYTAIQLYETHFVGQTKEKLEVRNGSLDHLYNGLEKEVEKMIRENDELFQKLIYFVDSYRQSLNTKGKIVKSVKGAVTRFSQSIDSKLKDCSSSDVSKCELFITEGDSAAGGLVQCRNPKYHAILGLKGKVPNLAAGNKDFLKNKELCEMINAMGCGVGSNFDVSSLRYSCVIIATDGDDDGDHIATLLITALLKVIPELFHHHKIFRAIMPLWGVKSYNGKFLPFYSEDEMRKFKAEHPKIDVTRYKGLGEMDPPQLAACLLDPSIRKLEEIHDCDATDAQAIFKLMTDAETKRSMLGEGDEE